MRGERFDLLIVGAGPAGIAAAYAASRAGARRIGMVDDNPAAGGQIWRGGGSTGGAGDWLGRFRGANCRTLFSTSIVAAPREGVLLAEDLDGSLELSYGKLILATGARERFLPFPGWTSTRVMGAGGLQAMVKSGMPIAGKRVVIAGSGPLPPAVAASLKKLGARILLIAEQASWEQLAGFALRLAWEPAKLAQAMGIWAKLPGVPFRANCWPARAADVGGGLWVTLASASGPIEVECDYLGYGFFLTPNLELPRLIGCAIEEGFVRVDRGQRTSRPGVYAAGEICGIGGLEKSLVEGEIAGYSAGGDSAAAARLHGARDRARRFAAALARGFALREELKRVADDATIVCRCEDVRLGALRAFRDARDAKLQTRCGMGACQGRICGAACEFLLGWEAPGGRPPIFPVEAGSLAVAD